ncbi:3-deoxy-manno-octulosonate cytidylyltransferase [Algoriphagus namhaensis]
MKTAALIPARLNSTRLPLKLIQDLGGKSVIQRTYLSTLETGLFDSVWVVTDSDEIKEQIEDLGGLVFRSKKEHESGSDRIAEALEQVEADVIVNVQGDEPIQDKTTLQNLISAFEDEQVEMASLKCQLAPQDADNPNYVKVITAANQDAVYFSRAKIPYDRDGNGVQYWKHIGVYGYRREALIRFTQADKSSLEDIEKLEQLRAFDLGIKIKMVETSFQAVAIDTEADLEKVRKLYFYK